MTPDLGPKELTILQAIHDGASTTTEIRERTILTTRQINYRINEYSLEALGLIDVERRDGRERQEFDDHERNTWASKRLQLTDRGIQILSQSETDDAENYEAMSQRELIEEVQELEERLDQLEIVFKEFRSTVMEQI